MSEPALLADHIDEQSDTILAVWRATVERVGDVPESERPPQEALEVDYDPWAGYQGPDRSGQLERPKRKRASPNDA